MANFSYDYYRELLQTILSNFELHRFSEVPRALTTLGHGQPKLLLRHDVDVSLSPALRMARIEAKLGIHANYFIMANSPLYSLRAISSRSMLLNLIEFGHEVGLHFDLHSGEHDNQSETQYIEQEILLDCRYLESIIGLPVRSISFHRPIPQLLRGPLVICNRINAYSEQLMTCYISDSKGKWRQGDPLTQLQNPEQPLLQLLIHPIWWGDRHMPPEDRLQQFFDEETRGRPCQYRMKSDFALARMIPAVRRRGVQNEATGGE